MTQKKKNDSAGSLHGQHKLPTTPAALGECNPDIGKDSPPPAPVRSSEMSRATPHTVCQSIITVSPNPPVPPKHLRITSHRDSLQDQFPKPPKLIQMTGTISPKFKKNNCPKTMKH
eukprot:3793506-Amphidinium_carterae.1